MDALGMARRDTGVFDVLLSRPDSDRNDAHSNQEAFHLFYQNHIAAVVGYFRRIGVFNRSDLEDLVQDTFVEAYRSWHNLKHPDAARAWLKTIAHRTFCRQLTSRFKQGQTISVIDGSPIVETLPDPTTVPTPSDVLTVERYTAICQLMDEIADPKRQYAVKMFYLGHASLKDISQTVGVGISTLTTWLARFRADAKARDRRETNT